MPKFEYKVVRAPSRCLTKKEVEGGADPAAFTLENLLNQAGVAGWEFYRAEQVTLETKGFFSTSRAQHDMLVFRRLPVTQTGPRDGLIDETSASTEIERTRNRRLKNPEMLGATLEGRRKVAPPRLYATAAE